LLIKNAKKDLDIAKIKEQNINSMLGLISKDKEVVLSKAQKLLALDSQETVAEIGEERDKALELEKTYQEITDNTENSLFDIAQEKIAIQDAFILPLSLGNLMLRVFAPYLAQLPCLSILNQALN
jgi:hypothetical protein